jgi:DNA-binding SARP family transcriptional activator
VAGIEFRILGPLEVLDGGRALDVGGAKQRSLLAVLLLNANQVVSSDRLIDALWGEQPPGTAGKAIQIYVSQLRRVLGKKRLETKAPGYLLRVDGDELDLYRFETLLTQAKETDPEAASAKLHEALALWPTSGSRSSRSGALRSCASPASRSGSTPTSPAAVTPSSSASWRRSWARIRSGSLCVGS